MEVVKYNYFGVKITGERERVNFCAKLIKELNGCKISKTVKYIIYLTIIPVIMYKY